MNKIICALLILGINLTILYPIANIKWLPETLLIFYVITRIFVTFDGAIEVLFTENKKINVNKKFYYFYWLRLLLFYKEYKLFNYFKLLGSSKDVVKFKDTQVEETFYDYVVDKLCNIVKISFNNANNQNNSGKKTKIS